MKPTLKSILVIDALKMALTQLQTRPGLMHHSDRGSQYASHDYQCELETHHITCVMSRKGNCYDNAVVESFFKSLKVECARQTYYQTREEAKQDIFDYIEFFYNRKRQHTTTLNS